MEEIGEDLKKLEQKDSQTEQEKQEKKHYPRTLQRAEKFLKS